MHFPLGCTQLETLATQANSVVVKVHALLVIGKDLKRPGRERKIIIDLMRSQEKKSLNHGVCVCVCVCVGGGGEHFI